MSTVSESLWESKEKQRKADVRFIVTLVLLIVFIATVLILNTKVYATVRVDGASMDSTLTDGDVLSVNILREADYGDIIVINAKTDTQEKWIIKRLIGKAGDTIEIKDGNVYRNGELLKEDYITQKTYQTGSLNKWIVPEGEIFFLGDNRGVSMDSRSDTFGTQEVERVIGVVANWSIKIKGFRGGVYTVIEKAGQLFGMQSCLTAGA